MTEFVSPYFKMFHNKTTMPKDNCSMLSQVLCHVNTYLQQDEIVARLMVVCVTEFADHSQSV